MLGFLHADAIEAGVRLPGNLSVSQDLKFADVLACRFASLEAIPTAGWLQIMVLACMQVYLVQVNVSTGEASPHSDRIQPVDISDRIISQL